jgi:hypothetical protein
VLERSYLVDDFNRDMNNAVGFNIALRGSLEKVNSVGKWVEPQVRSPIRLDYHHYHYHHQPHYHHIVMIIINTATTVTRTLTILTTLSAPIRDQQVWNPVWPRNQICERCMAAGSWMLAFCVYCNCVAHMQCLPDREQV